MPQQPCAVACSIRVSGPPPTVAAGRLHFVAAPPADTTVKGETPEAAATSGGGSPPFVAEWVPEPSAAPGESNSSKLRLDLRCDVTELLVSNKPPALSAKIIFSGQRVQQQNLGPLPATASSAVLAFDTTDDRTLFVDALKHWRLPSEDAQVLRQLAAAAAAAAASSVNSGTAASAGLGGGGDTTTLDVKDILKVKEERAQGLPPTAMPEGIVIQTAEERARERAWFRHDADLRQLFNALVSSGVITEEEFTIAYSEERSAFFADNTWHQRRGLDSLQDAVGDLVDPETHQLRIIDEQMAARIFAQSPAIAAAYRLRVKSAEDELVFWDAVVRRALFLARTTLDTVIEQSASSEAVAAPARGDASNNSSSTNPLEAMQRAWNARSDVALDLAAAEAAAAGAAAAGDSEATTTITAKTNTSRVRPREEAGSSIGGAAATPAAAGGGVGLNVAPQDEAHRRREHGRHRREAGDAEAEGGMVAISAIDAKQHTFIMDGLDDDNIIDGDDRDGNADHEGSTATLVKMAETERQLRRQRRIEVNFGASLPSASSTSSSVVRVQRPVLPGYDGTSATATAPAGSNSAERLWGPMIAVVDTLCSPETIATPAARSSGGGMAGVPLSLRTCHSLHRLYFRQFFLAVEHMKAVAAGAASPSVVSPQVRRTVEQSVRRASEILVALGRAKDKAFADEPLPAAAVPGHNGNGDAATPPANDPQSPWAIGCREVETLLRRATAAQVALENLGTQMASASSGHIAKAR